MSPSDKSVLKFVLLLLVSEFGLALLVHEAGHLCWICLFKYNGPVIMRGYWPEPWSIEVPTLNLMPADLLLIMPGVFLGGFVEGLYWLWLVRFAPPDSSDVISLIQIVAGSRFTYASLEVIRNIPPLQEVSFLWDHPLLVCYPLGFLLAWLFFFPEDLKLRIQTYCALGALKLSRLEDKQGQGSDG